MTTRLLLSILVYAAIVFIPGGLLAALGWKLFKWREKRRLTPKISFKQLPDPAVCYSCGKKVSPAVDEYTPRLGWSCADCYAKTIG